MCVDGPEDRGSIARYGSPDRMPVLSRKERTLPMRSLPAAFAVFRIPPPAGSLASRPLIFNRRTLCGGCLSSFEGSSNNSRTSPGVFTDRGPGSFILSEDGRPSNEDSPTWLFGVGKLCHVFSNLDQKMGLAALRNPSKNEQST